MRTNRTNKKTAAIDAVMAEVQREINRLQGVQLCLLEFKQTARKSACRGSAAWTGVPSERLEKKPKDLNDPNQPK